MMKTLTIADRVTGMATFLQGSRRVVVENVTALVLPTPQPALVAISGLETYGKQPGISYDDIPVIGRIIIGGS